MRKVNDSGGPAANSARPKKLAGGDVTIARPDDIFQVDANGRAGEE